MTVSQSAMDFVESTVTALRRVPAPARRDMKNSYVTASRYATLAVGRTASARNPEFANALRATRKSPRMVHVSQSAIQIVDLINSARSPISAIVWKVTRLERRASVIRSVSPTVDHTADASSRENVSARRDSPDQMRRSANQCAAQNVESTAAA